MASESYQGLFGDSKFDKANKLAVQTWGAFFDPMMPGGGSSLVVAVIEVVRKKVGLRVQGLGCRV